MYKPSGNSTASSEQKGLRLSSPPPFHQTVLPEIVPHFRSTLSHFKVSAIFFQKKKEQKIRSEVALGDNKSIYVTNIQKWKLMVLADNVAY